MESRLMQSTRPTISTPTRSLRTNLTLWSSMWLFPLGKPHSFLKFIFFFLLDTTGTVCRYALKNFTDKEAMLNAEDTGSMENLFEIRRYQIDMENEQVRPIQISIQISNLLT